MPPAGSMIPYPYIGPLMLCPMAERRKVPEYVDPLPQEYHDSVARFNREVIARSSEIPRDELRRLIAAERERQQPYLQMESRAMCEYLVALVGIDPKEIKKVSDAEGGLAKYVPRGFDSVEAVRAVRGHGP